MGKLLTPPHPTHPGNSSAYLQGRCTWAAEGRVLCRVLLYRTCRAWWQFIWPSYADMPGLAEEGHCLSVLEAWTPGQNVHSPKRYHQCGPAPHGMARTTGLWSRYIGTNWRGREGGGDAGHTQPLSASGLSEEKKAED